MFFKALFIVSELNSSHSVHYKAAELNCSELGVVQHKRAVQLSSVHDVPM